MLNALKRLFSPSFRDESHLTYVAVVEQSRLPVFYSQYQAPDTLDGRFDVIALHLAMVVDALRKNGSPDALEFSRLLMEVFFSDMDRSLREMGVGDTGISHRIRKMAQALYGRLQAYEDSLGDNAALQQAIARNLFRSAPASEQSLAALASYMQRTSSQLQTPQAISKILAGQVEFTEAP